MKGRPKNERINVILTFDEFALVFMTFSICMKVCLYNPC